MAIEIEARVLGRRKANLKSRSLELGGLAAEPTLGGVIAAVVRSEVASFVNRKDDERLMRFLTASEIAEGQAGGKIVIGGLGDEVPTEVDVDQAVAAALLAFEDGLFQVIVDRTNIESLDEVVRVSDGSQVMFLRLVALAGG